MIDAGILLGLPRAVAADLIVQSAFGPPGCCVSPPTTR